MEVTQGRWLSGWRQCPLLEVPHIVRVIATIGARQQATCPIEKVGDMEARQATVRAWVPRFRLNGHTLWYTTRAYSGPTGRANRGKRGRWTRIAKTVEGWSNFITK